MAKYVYPAIFTLEDKGMYSVNFLDLDGCYTCGDDLAHAILMAEDVLAYVLYDWEKAGKVIPSPSDITSLNISDGEFVNMIICDTLDYHKKHSTRAVKKTLSIPEWLDEAATAADVNFSYVLQEALKDKLGIVGPV